MLSIGIVGSESTAERILALSGVFKAENDVTFVKFAYDNVQDTQSIVRENDERIDIWLFSGELSFMIAKKTLSTDDHLVYVKTTEANLYKCFLEIGHDYNNAVDTVSIDDNAEDTINDAMEQLSFNFGEVFIQTYDVDTDIEGLYKHHLSLYETGKVKAVITSFEKVYSNLSEQGIPAYWYTMSNTEIKQALLIVKEKMKTLYFKETQIAIVMVDVDGFDKVIENAKSPYQLQYMELKIKEQLIELCQSLNGSLLEKGNGRYAIFSSRGIIEKNIGKINQLKQSFSTVHKITASIGIGFGETAFSAELNAVQAVRQNEKRTHPESVMIQDEGIVIETRGNKKYMAFSTVSTEGIVSDKLRDANISLRTYNKIIGMINSIGRHEFTSKDLVNHLHIEARNSRRIVTSLSQVGLLEHVGDQASETKGRPSKVYRLVSVKD